MPQDLIVRILPAADYIYPPFMERGLELLARLRKRGADYFVTRGYATFAAQGALHALWTAGKGGRAAPAGDSSHCYGLAWDLTRDLDPSKAGLQPSWDPKLYALIGEECAALGLHHGASYGDLPHVSWPGFVSAKQLDPLKSRFLHPFHTREAVQQDRPNLFLLTEYVWPYVTKNSPALPALR